MEADKKKSVPITKDYGLVSYPPLTWKLTTPGFPVEVCVCPPPPPKKIVVVAKAKPPVKVVEVPVKKPVIISASGLLEAICCQLAIPALEEIEGPARAMQPACKAHLQQMHMPAKAQL